MLPRRTLFLAGLAIAPKIAFATDGGDGWTQAARPGAIVLLRHAIAPGIGDPSDFRIGECATQRNLDAQGRRQARQIGEQFRQRGIPVSEVWHSQWCRTRETSELAFPGAGRDQPAFNSFFGGRGQADPQTEQARSLLQQWRGPGVLVVVTHQVNIQALVGAFTGSGEGVVLRPDAAGALQVVGRIDSQARAVSGR